MSGQIVARIVDSRVACVSSLQSLGQVECHAPVLETLLCVLLRSLVERKGVVDLSARIALDISQNVVIVGLSGQI